MPSPLHVLVLEDRPTDAELMIDALTQAGFEPVWRRVETEGEFLNGLEPAPDIILADYHLPHYHGLDALRTVRQRNIDVPFILVSGSIGEEEAVGALKSGATDYLLKDSLERLGQAVMHAIEQKRLRSDQTRMEQALRESEERFRALVEKSRDGIAVLDAEGRIRYINPAGARIMLADEARLTGARFFEGFPPEERKAFERILSRVSAKPGTSISGRFLIVRRDGNCRWVEGEWTNLLEEPAIGGVLLNYREASDQNAAEDQALMAEARVGGLEPT